MASDLKGILAELREDHRNISMLLDLVEAQLLRVDKGETPDLELLHDIMQYMTIYSDAIHHPKEDLVYAKMRAASPDVARGLEGVEVDHREIADLGRSLREDVEALTLGVAQTRESLMRDMIDYVRRMRKHMEWEEQDLFLRADSLAEKDNYDLVLGALDRGDPVFGATSEAAFANLLRHLKMAAANA